MAKEDKKETRIKGIDSGAALQKGVSELREGQKPAKPAGLVRPRGVVVPPAPNTQNSGNQNSGSSQKK